MGSLLVTERPGIFVVSGIITDIEKDKITLENECSLPLSRICEKRKCIISFDDAKIKRMGLRVGAFVICTTADNDFNLSMLAEGGETDDKIYYLKGYNIRYNGSFDFEEKGVEKEQHVFAGTIFSPKVGKYHGKAWCSIKLGYRKCGENIYKNLIVWGDDAIRISQLEKNKAIFVTGKKESSNSGIENYCVKNFIL